MRYAEICVNTPLGRRIGLSLGSDSAADPLARTFTYAVPAALANRLQPGHLVWVPFRGRRLQGIVMAIGDTPPEFDTQEIVSLVWAQPVLTPAQLELARWVSSYYVAPLIEALRLMLPAHITQRGRTVFARTQEPVSGELPPRQQALLARIEEAEGTWPEISEGLGKVTQAADLEPLIAQGLVSREVAFATPPPRPKVNRQVTLIADEATAARVLPTLGRTSVHADILTWLSGQSDPEPRLDQLCAALGITPARARDLSARGGFAVSEPKTFVRRAVPDADLPAALDGLKRAAKQAAALAALPGLQAEPVDAAGFRAREQVSDVTLRGLITRGLATCVEEPATVRLTVDRAALPETLIELRGGERFRTVVDALRRHEGPAWIGWVYAQTGVDIDTLRTLEGAGLISIAEEVVWRDPLAGQEFRPSLAPALTADQARALQEVQRGMAAGGRAYLIYGVTGSGKTEVYLHAIAEALARGEQAVVLVPEIALTPQTIRRFAARFPGRVTVWHSHLSDGERFDIWRRVRTGHPAAQVVVGSRSALFLAYPRLGLIVVDEEHESSYKQIMTPRYHARTAALELGKLARATVLLGSATPALETYYAARHGAIELLTLPRRVLANHEAAGRAPQPGAPQPAASEANQAPTAPAAAAPAPGRPAAGQLPLTALPAAAQPPASPGKAAVSRPAPVPVTPAAHGDLPRVEVIDMRQELRVGNRSMFSRSLAAALTQVLKRNEQAILYLNRRGSASFVMCRDCGHVEICPRCNVPLTYHGSGATLVCHHCNRRYPVPMVCPNCGSRRIRYFGSGTENVEEAVQQAFPSARTMRWDRDVTGAKGAHEALLARFVAHEADVLIGTQMIAKGLDLPLVTLVGVIAADTGLFLPDFRAGERTFQLLTQVAGRAGRSALGGKVIIQTYHPDHYAVVAASHHDYESFYRQEMTFRREQGYPPIRRLARLVYHATKRETAQAEAERMAEALKAEIAAQALPNLELIGPAPCFFSLQRNEYRWQIILRGDDPAAAIRSVATGPGWRVDVDPTDLL